MHDIYTMHDFKCLSKINTKDSKQWMTTTTFEK